MTAWVGPKTWDLLPLAGPRPRPRVGTLGATQGRHVGACNALEAMHDNLTTIVLSCLKIHSKQQ